MKKLFTSLFLLGALFTTVDTKAQVSVGLNVNIGNQPAWGPVGYDHVDYYYLPDIDAYYSVPQRQFVYYDNNRWIRARALPPRYGNYDLYTGYKVVVNEPRPYLRADYYRSNYGKYKGWKGERQIVIRDSRDDKYKHHDNGWHGNNPKSKGKGKGHH
ncbi:hypothetical protein [Sediminibacterium roseum]|uniref:hypothetical protein n=1 Tax=Sediminibacterium roseum TaxID=1978412 RepID=UPI00192A5215|nr:hypothetical protein [Sediminibacterium roseum]